MLTNNLQHAMLQNVDLKSTKKGEKNDRQA